MVGNKNKLAVLRQCCFWNYIFKHRKLLNQHNYYFISKAEGSKLYWQWFRCDDLVFCYCFTWNWNNQNKHIYILLAKFYTVKIFSFNLKLRLVCYSKFSFILKLATSFKWLQTNNSLKLIFFKLFPMSTSLTVVWN
jgi:hypothetical protein